MEARKKAWTGAGDCTWSSPSSASKRASRRGPEARASPRCTSKAARSAVTPACESDSGVAGLLSTAACTFSSPAARAASRAPRSSLASWAQPSLGTNPYLPRGEEGRGRAVESGAVESGAVEAGLWKRGCGSGAVEAGLRKAHCAKSCSLEYCGSYEIVISSPLASGLSAVTVTPSSSAREVAGGVC